MRDCRKYIDAVKICFSGVKDLICALPSNLQNDEEESNGSPRLKNMKQLNFDIHGIYIRLSFLFLLLLT